MTTDEMIAIRGGEGAETAYLEKDDPNTQRTAIHNPQELPRKEERRLRLQPCRQVGRQPQRHQGQVV